jgi:hypothetical protein
MTHRAGTRGVLRYARLLVGFSLAVTLALAGCALRNRFQAGRDIDYTNTVTISPEADISGLDLPGLPGTN